MCIRDSFRRKIAVVALIVLVSLFLLVFIGPLFCPMDLSFTDSNQANLAPVFNMRSVPSALKKDIANISGFANFTVGVSKDNNLYVCLLYTSRCV